MSEQEVKITSVAKTEDQKRVEAGKRLAMISKQAKERKMRQKIESEVEENNTGNLSNTYIFGLSGLVISIFGFNYTQKRFFLEEKQYKDEEEVVKTQTPPKRINNLDSFD